MQLKDPVKFLLPEVETVIGHEEVAEAVLELQQRFCPKWTEVTAESPTVAAATAPVSDAACARDFLFKHGAILTLIACNIGGVFGLSSYGKVASLGCSTVISQRPQIVRKVGWSRDSYASTKVSSSAPKRATKKSDGALLKEVDGSFLSLCIVGLRAYEAVLNSRRVRITRNNSRPGNKYSTGFVAVSIIKILDQKYNAFPRVLPVQLPNLPPQQAPAVDTSEPPLPVPDARPVVLRELSGVAAEMLGLMDRLALVPDSSIDRRAIFPDQLHHCLLTETSLFKGIDLQSLLSNCAAASGEVYPYLFPLAGSLFDYLIEMTQVSEMTGWLSIVNNRSTSSGILGVKQVTKSSRYRKMFCKLVVFCVIRGGAIVREVVNEGNIHSAMLHICCCLCREFGGTSSSFMTDLLSGLLCSPSEDRSSMVLLDIASGQRCCSQLGFCVKLVFTASILLNVRYSSLDSDKAFSDEFAILRDPDFSRLPAMVSLFRVQNVLQHWSDLESHVSVFPLWNEWPEGDCGVIRLGKYVCFKDLGKVWTHNIDRLYLLLFQLLGDAPAVSFLRGLPTSGASVVSDDPNIERPVIDFWDSNHHFSLHDIEKDFKARSTTSSGANTALAVLSEVCTLMTVVGYLENVCRASELSSQVLYSNVVEISATPPKSQLITQRNTSLMIIGDNLCVLGTRLDRKWGKGDVSQVTSLFSSYTPQFSRVIVVMGALKGSIPHLLKLAFPEKPLPSKAALSMLFCGGDFCPYFVGVDDDDETSDTVNEVVNSSIARTWVTLGLEGEGKQAPTCSDIRQLWTQGTLTVLTTGNSMARGATFRWTRPR